MSPKKHCRIHVLDKQTANQIAAGEVAERPVSVVKELVENAIDAGATKITVRLYDAQCERIKVIDNGCGMSPEELRLSIQRHATSKIKRASDLENLTTLGFRGEALPSIAAVSQLTITSRQEDNELAYTLRIRDGQAGLPEEDAAAVGTTVFVERLFYNAPARRKFLKSPRTELGLISDHISKLALSHPHIAFTLINGNHRIIVTDGRGLLKQVVLKLYGPEMMEELLIFDADDPFPVNGLLSLPSLNRSNRSGYYFFVNDRPVRSRELTQAVDEAYDTLMPEGRYACVFLFLKLPPDSIDVNVHPSKLEIKFRDSNAVSQGLKTALKNALLSNMDSLPRLSERATAPIGSQLLPTHEEGTELIHEQLKPGMAEIRPLTGTALFRSLITGDPAAAIIGGQIMSVEKIEQLLDRADMIEQGITPPPPEQSSIKKGGFYSSLYVMGQFAGTFIIALSDKAIYLIDQHAAAERIAFEKISARAALSGDESALLTLPFPLSLSPQDCVLITDLMLPVRDFGFILEHFGGNKYVIRGVPLWYEGKEPETLLRDLLEILKEGGNTQELRREKLIMAACKQAVKANSYLSLPEMNRLLADLDRCENSKTCPHGRPIACALTLDDIRKRFLRSGI